MAGLTEGASRILRRVAVGAWQRRPTTPGELYALIGVLLAAMATFAFVEIAGHVLQGNTTAFDRPLMLALRSASNITDPIGPRWLEEVARDITALGSNVILVIVTASVAVFLLLAHKRGAAWLVLASVGGGAALSSLLKLGFQRSRPDLVPHAVEVYTASFPSGHAMLSAVTYLTLGALLMRVQPGWAVKIYILSLAVLITFLVGVSRVYLGVHWPTDVLAGWSIGAAWALLCWAVALWLQRAGQVEKEGFTSQPTQ